MKLVLRCVLGVLLSSHLVGCRGHVLIDPNPSAVASGDRNLVMAACSTVPSRGMDICRVMKGAPISTRWSLVVPYDEKTFISGEIHITFKDKSKTFEIKSRVVEIDLSELLEAPVWLQAHDQPIQAHGIVKFKDGQFERLVDLLGYLFIVVTDQSYAPLPFDSGLTYSATLCKTTYTTAGRSFVDCSR